MQFSNVVRPILKLQSCPSVGRDIAIVSHVELLLHSREFSDVLPTGTSKISESQIPL